MSDNDTGTSLLSKDKPSECSENQNPVPTDKGIDAVGILWTFGKCLTALLPVYLAGYYRVSSSLVVFGLALYSGWKHTRAVKEARLRSAIQLLNEKSESSSSVYRSQKDLPAWVNFPDVEKVEWLNKVIQQAWPFIGQYLEKLLTESIAPSIRSSSVHLQTLNFTKIDFGDKAMKVVGVKAHTENEKGQVLLDVYIRSSKDSFIHLLPLIRTTSGHGEPVPISASSDIKAGYILDGVPTYRRAHTHSFTHAVTQ